jgi:methyl-accepting chemotaxis protein
MRLFSYIRRSFATQITLWVVGFATLILGVILILMAHFSNTLTNGVGDYKLMTIAILVAVISLLVLLLLTWWIVSSHLRPLDQLAASAQQLTEKLQVDQGDGFMLRNWGKAPVPVVHGRKDEIGQLQSSFMTMQHSLSDYISEMQQKRSTLSRQNDELQRAYDKARESDNIKAQFLSRMTEQMVQNVDTISTLTDRLCDHYKELSKSDLVKIQIQMLTSTDAVVLLLDQMLNSPRTPETPAAP